MSVSELAVMVSWWVTKKYLHLNSVLSTDLQWGDIQTVMMMTHTENLTGVAKREGQGECMSILVFLKNSCHLQFSNVIFVSLTTDYNSL